MDELTNGLRNVERDSDVLDSEGVAGKIEETIRQIWKDGAPMDVVCGRSPSCPPEVEAQFLANIDAIENAPISNLTDELLKKGIVVPKPDELDDAELYAKLWEVLNALADMRHYLYPTDHLSDRELYAKLYEEILPEETEIVSSASGWNTHIEVLRAGCEEDDHTWLKYYADEQTRASWRKNFPDLEIPAHEDPPYHRDIELPQPDPPTH
jgi:hypothetical protein